MNENNNQNDLNQTNLNNNMMQNNPVNNQINNGANVVNNNPVQPVPNINPNPVQGQNQINNPVPKKDNKKLFIIIGGVIGLIVILLIVYLLFIKSDKNTAKKEVNDYNKVLKKEEKMSKNIEVKILAEYTDHDEKEILYSVTNNNSETVNYISDAYIKFFDKDNTQISTEDIFTYCIPGSSTLYYVTDGTNYDHYELDTDNISISYYEEDSEYYDCVDFKDKYVIDIQKGKEGYLKVLMTNNTSNSITLFGIIAYKKDNKIIDTSLVNFSSVSSGITSSYDLIIPYGSDYKRISYDSTEFLLSSVSKR